MSRASARGSAASAHEAPAAAAERLDNQHPALFGQTPWQTVGPFFHFSLPRKGGADLTGPSELGARPDLLTPGRDGLPGPERRAGSRQPFGERIELTGRVLDARGLPLADALLEIWQANAAGYYRDSAEKDAPVALDSAFFGFGRAASAEDGSFRFRTIRPGRVPLPEVARTAQAPHIALGILGRGLLKRLVTRIYFEDEPSNAEDPVLALVPKHRQATLLARRIEGSQTDTGADASYRFDVHLQGAQETVFFEW